MLSDYDVLIGTSVRYPIVLMQLLHAGAQKLHDEHGCLQRHHLSATDQGPPQWKHHDRQSRTHHSYR